jgi:hypothetical protein
MLIETSFQSIQLPLAVPDTQHLIPNTQNSLVATVDDAFVSLGDHEGLDLSGSIDRDTHQD